MRYIALAVFIALGGCSFQPQPSAPPAQPVPTTADDPAPRQEPRSRYGNPASYTQFGRRYNVLADAAGFRERGIASWYGRDFHGKRTSSGEPYDMFAMTAAHKTLPLPTWVEVRNLKNNRRIVVRVNDRGPFVANRIIDLSYEAARRLDLVQNGTGLVEIAALQFDAAGNVREANPAPQRTATVVRHAEPAKPMDSTTATAEPAVDATPAPSPEPPSAAAPPPARLFVQVGAFRSLDNAESMFIRLRETGFGPLDIVTVADETPPLFRVRIGPVSDAAALDSLVDELHQAEIATTRVVIE